jgi:hypothetical protein
VQAEVIQAHFDQALLQSPHYRKDVDVWHREQAGKHKGQAPAGGQAGPPWQVRGRAVGAPPKVPPGDCR